MAYGTSTYLSILYSQGEGVGVLSCLGDPGSCASAGALNIRDTILDGAEARQTGLPLFVAKGDRLNLD